jgi:predicted RNA-binding protein YlqC (UPF0109 family)
MRNLIEFVLLHLVSHPDEVEVEEVELEDGRLEYLLHVHPEDRGHVIGRNGRTIEALRTLVRVRAMKENKGVRITLFEEEAAQDEVPEEEAVEVAETV